MKKLRITVDGKVFDVSVELLDQVSSTTAAPAPAPVAAPCSCRIRTRGHPGPAWLPHLRLLRPPPAQETLPARLPGRSSPWTWQQAHP